MKAYEIYTQTRVEYANYSGQTFISIFQSEGSETVSDSHGHFWKVIEFSWRPLLKWRSRPLDNSVEAMSSFGWHQRIQKKTVQRQLARKNIKFSV